MSRLLDWQREGYPRYHRNRTNLLLHIATAPFFWLGLFLIALAFYEGSGTDLLLGLILLPAVMAIQGRGHKMEQEPPVPFAGPADAFKRIFGEQLINFPRFVFSGGWSSALAKAKREPPPIAMPYGLPPSAVVVHALPSLAAAPTAPATSPAPSAEAPPPLSPSQTTVQAATPQASPAESPTTPGPTPS
jgi:hypothetical protein